MAMNKIVVVATSRYLPDQSTPADNRYAFSYHITISNDGEQAAQLVSRHWVITDGNEKVQQVKGPGVIGEKPTILPGDSFEYTSGAFMNTVVGIMQGTYFMVAEDGTEFEVTIEPFTLAVPNQVH